MPRYTYIAKSQPYKPTQGYIEAESEQDAINKLTAMGYFPLSVRYETLSLDKQSMISFRKIATKDIVLFTRQLSTLIESGVNILNALNIISNQNANKNFGILISDIASRIRDGNPLSSSLAAFPNLFSNLYCALIRTGESSGELNVALKRLADFLEKEEEFKNSLRAGLTYPAIVFGVSVLTVAFLLTFVIPRLVGMFEDMGQALPLPTQILINISSFLRGYWWAMVAVIIVLIFLSGRLKKSPKGRLAWDSIKLKLIAIGDLTLKTEVARLMRTLSLLLSSGIAITPALEDAVTVLDNQVLRAEVVKFKEQINSGSSFSAALRNSKSFPDFVLNIVAIGEESGELDKSLMRIATDYERQVDATLKTFIRLLEPVIILIMGAVVGFIVVSMLLPIFQINLIAR